MFEDTKNIDYIDIFHYCCFGNCIIHWFVIIRYKIIVNAKKYEIEIMFKRRNILIISTYFVFMIFKTVKCE